MRKNQEHTPNRNPPGREAEQWSRHYLEQHGLRTLEANYRTSRGEIDLIMLEGNTLVFVEVRLRSNPGYASAAQSITHAKQQRIIASAEHYLQAKKLGDKHPCRFDAVCLSKDRGNTKAYQVEWLRNAFSLP